MTQSFYRGWTDSCIHKFELTAGGAEPYTIGDDVSKDVWPFFETGESDTWAFAEPFPFMVLSLVVMEKAIAAQKY